MLKNDASLTLLVNNNKKYLFYLRDEKSSIYYPGTWSLLGGTAENDESPQETAIREVKEEIDYDIKLDKFIGSFIDDYDNYINVFKAKIDKRIEEIILTEGQRLKYFDFEMALKINLVPPLKKFLIENKDKVIN